MNEVTTAVITEDLSNQKLRLVTCLDCKVDFETKERQHRCLLCGKIMVTVLYSLLTGERITK